MPEQGNVTNETIQQCLSLDHLELGVDLKSCAYIWKSMVMIDNVYKIRTKIRRESKTSQATQPTTREAAIQM